MNDDMHPVVGSVVAIIAVATGAFGLWCSYLAFAGGKAPVFGWQFEGSAGAGFTWLFFITPLITTVGYWIAMLVALPLAAVFRSDR